jgi:hypothetical protein
VKYKQAAVSGFTTSDAASRHHHGHDRQTLTSSNACQTGSTSDFVAVDGTIPAAGDDDGAVGTISVLIGSFTVTSVTVDIGG